jgi:hypothetical protein
MPVIGDIPLRLKIAEVLRREGFRKHTKIRPEIKNLILELLARVQQDHLLEPAVAYEIYAITEMSRRQLSLEGKRVVHGALLPSLLAEAKELVTVVCTIGPKLEKRAANYFNRDKPLEGLLLDGIGSAAVDSLVEEVCKFMTAEALSRGYQASSPISPGMPGFPMTEQWQLIKMVPVQKIGVSLTSSGVMVPRKSASMVIGIGPQMRRWTPAEVCTRCNLKKTCPYRIDSSKRDREKTRGGSHEQLCH